MLKKNTKEDFECIFQKVFSAHRKGRFAEAEKGYLAVLKINPDSGRVLNALGTLCLDQSQPERARTVFEKAVNLNPPSLSACYNLGRMKQQENDHMGAIPVYKRMLDEQPTIGEAWNNLGVAYRETGQPDEAIASFEKAVVFAPDMAQAWNNLGVAQDELHLTEKASDSYKKAIGIQPDYLSAHFNFGILLQKAEQFKKAGNTTIGCLGCSRTIRRQGSCFKAWEALRKHLMPPRWSMCEVFLTGVPKILKLSWLMNWTTKPPNYCLSLCVPT